MNISGYICVPDIKPIQGQGPPGFENLDKQIRKKRENKSVIGEPRIQKNMLSVIAVGTENIQKRKFDGQ